jgi:DinB superfamily
MDLRRAPLADLFRVDFRRETRDLWVDEAALWDRLIASWAGLDDAAWRLQGAARSDAGGPDWSLLDHVAHLADWQEIAADYIERAIATGEWPSDDDFDGGDFDRFNERRRELYGDLTPAELRRRLEAGRAALLPVARRLDPEAIRSDDAWGWVYNVLHGHNLDHLRVIEPWAEALRARQVQKDPFGRDPQPLASELKASRAAFWSDDASVTALFRETVFGLPDEAWTGIEVTDGWSVADHVGHLAAWFDEVALIMDDHARDGTWPELPPGYVDAWNATDVVARRGTEPAALREAFDAGHARLAAAIEAMPDRDWLDPESFSWAYEDLHGHVRAHLAMIAPYAARAGWPPG